MPLKVVVVEDAGDELRRVIAEAVAMGHGPEIVEACAFAGVDGMLVETLTLDEMRRQGCPHGEPAHG